MAQSATAGALKFLLHGAILTRKFKSPITEEKATKMDWKNPYLPTFLNLIGATSLLAGLIAAGLIYHRAGNVPYGAWGYVNADGTISAVGPADSKMYRHNLEVYGGKANIIMDDFRRWLAGLWHGKSLAVIVGGSALLLAYGCFYTANYALPRWKSDALSENQQDSAGY